MPSLPGVTSRTPLLLLFLIHTFSVLPLATASVMPQFWVRSPVPAGDLPSTPGFEKLGSVDTVSGGTPTTLLYPSPSDQGEQEAPPPPLSTSNLANSTPPSSCASSPLWYTPPLSSASSSESAINNFVTDCHLAIQHLYLTDVHFSASSNNPMEFIAPAGTAGLQEGMSHSYMMGDYIQETPIVYEANTCTLAIVMMGHFLNITHSLGGKGVLPGGIARGGVVETGKKGKNSPSGMKGTAKRLAGNDVSTWRKLHMAGRNIENQCLKNWGRGGWVSAGANDDIGVFLWATNSTLDRAIRPALEHTTQLIGSGNGTSVQSNTTITPPAPPVKAKGIPEPHR